MDPTEMKALAEQVAVAESLDHDLRAHIVASLATTPVLAGVTLSEDIFSSTDAILLLVDKALPGWSVHLDGAAREVHGDWHCTLRKSEVRGDDAFVGTGQGEQLPNALLAALLRALSQTK